MNKTVILCLFLYTLTFADDPGQVIEYSHNPLSPGYGISNYFELMPDKVSRIKILKPPNQFPFRATVDIRVIGNILRVVIPRDIEKEIEKISIINISGRKILCLDLPSENATRSVYHFNLKSFSKGVYFVVIKVSNRNILMKFLFF